MIVIVNKVALIVVMLWAFWALVTQQEDDSVIGKILYLLVILAALAEFSSNVTPPLSVVQFRCAIALVGIRRLWLAVCWRWGSRIMNKHFDRRRPRNPE